MEIFWWKLLFLFDLYFDRFVDIFFLLNLVFFIDIVFIKDRKLYKCVNFDY